MDYDTYLRRREARPTSPAPIKRVESLAEWKPVFEHAPNQPPAIRSNGGIRGSAATGRRTGRWE